MQTYRIETTVSKNGTLTIKGLPLRVGDKVEVIVHSPKSGEESNERYPLRGKPVRYDNPFESVAEEEWDALK